MKPFLAAVSLAAVAAATPAAADLRKHEVDFVVEKSEVAGTATGWEGRKILVPEADRKMVECDDESGPGGKASCWIKCDPASGPRRTYEVSFQDAPDYDRRPYPKLKLSVKGCDIRVEPLSATIVYVNVRVLLAEASKFLDSFVAANGAYKPALSAGSAAARRLFALSLDELGTDGGFARLKQFQALSRDLSALHMRMGDQTKAAFYSSIATTTANAVVFDLGRQLNIDVQAGNAKNPGTLKAYYSNLGTLDSMISEKYKGSQPATVNVKSTTKLLRTLKTEELNGSQFKKLNRALSTLREIKG